MDSPTRSSMIVMVLWACCSTSGDSSIYRWIPLLSPQKHTTQLLFFQVKVVTSESTDKAATGGHEVGCMHYLPSAQQGRGWSLVAALQTPHPACHTSLGLFAVPQTLPVAENACTNAMTN